MKYFKYLLLISSTALAANGKVDLRLIENARNALGSLDQCVVVTFQHEQLYHYPCLVMKAQTVESFVKATGPSFVELLKRIPVACKDAGITQTYEMSGRNATEICSFDRNKGPNEGHMLCSQVTGYCPAENPRTAKKNLIEALNRLAAANKTAPKKYFGEAWVLPAMCGLATGDNVNLQITSGIGQNQAAAYKNLKELCPDPNHLYSKIEASTAVSEVSPKALTTAVRILPKMRGAWVCSAACGKVEFNFYGRKTNTETASGLGETRAEAFARLQSACSTNMFLTIQDQSSMTLADESFKYNDGGCVQVR